MAGAPEKRHTLFWLCSNPSFGLSRRGETREEAHIVLGGFASVLLPPRGGRKGHTLFWVGSHRSSGPLGAGTREGTHIVVGGFASVPWPFRGSAGVSCVAVCEFPTIIRYDGELIFRKTKLTRLSGYLNKKKAWHL